MMPLISTWQQIEDNLRQLAMYLQSPNDEERDYAKDLVRLGKCFVISGTGDDVLVGPSRFIGYVNNTLQEHRANESKDGRDTNPVIAGILGHQPEEDLSLEEVYQAFCERLGVRDCARITRKFWRPQ